MASDDQDVWDEIDATLDQYQKDYTAAILDHCKNLPSDSNPPPIDDLDSDDLMAAFRQVFADGVERDRDDAIRDVARELGYARTGARIRETLDGQMRAAVRRGIIAREGDLYRIFCRSIDNYSRDNLVEILLSAIGPAWCTREDAITAATRHLGFRRTGKNIHAAFKSALNAAIRRGRIERDGPEQIRRL